MLRLSRFWNKAPTTTPVYLKPSVDLSFTALFYFGATLFIGLAAMNSQTNLLFGVFGLMVGVLLVSGYISRFSLRKLKVRRIMPEHLVVGESAALTYEITNDKRYWPSISVSLGELDSCEAFTRQPYTYLLHVAPKLKATASEEIKPKRRGICELDQYQLSTSFPFGFIKRATTLQQKDTVVIFPPLARVDRRVLSLFQSAEKTGASVRPRKGGNDEFYGIKEYRTGENPRMIHWRKSARTGQLVCREMTQVAPPRLLLVVDTYRVNDAPEHIADVERAIAVAASLASYALEEGYPVGLFTWSGNWVNLEPGRGKRHRRELLTVLAQLADNHSVTLPELLEASMPLVELGTTEVVLTPRPGTHSHAERTNRAVVILSSVDAEAMRWFLFPEGINFADCNPLPAKAGKKTDKPADAAASAGSEVAHV